METFKASVQYGDWHGTSAADDSDQQSLEQYLEKHDLIKDDEVLLAASLYVGDNQPDKLANVFVHAFLFRGPRNMDELKDTLDSIAEAIPVRRVELKLTLKDFVCLFKRFDVMLTWQKLPLQDRKYDAEE